MAAHSEERTLLDGRMQGQRASDSGLGEVVVGSRYITVEVLEDLTLFHSANQGTV